MLPRIRKFVSRNLTAVLSTIDPCLRRWAAHSRFFSGVYYAFCSSAFRREQQAFLQGQQAYEQQLNSPEPGFALLRRNIHRLEKGLTMRPQRGVFAREYIEETVESFVHLNRVQCPENTEIKWARDVLTLFFSSTQPDPILDRAKAKFLTHFQPDSSPLTSVPYQRDTNCLPDISVDDLLQLARHRRSVRWFENRPVEREKIDRAIEIAGLSPSACNRQPYVFRVFDTAPMVKQVAQVPMGTAGYSENIPVMIVLVGQQRNYFDERDRHLIYIDSSLAAMSFVFAAEVQGLSTCCINWPDMESTERRMANLIGLAPDERPVMCIAVGYPDMAGLVAYSQKKPLALIRNYHSSLETMETANQVNP